MTFFSLITSPFTKLYTIIFIKNSFKSNNSYLTFLATELKLFYLFSSSNQNINSKLDISKNLTSNHSLFYQKSKNFNLFFYFFYKNSLVNVSSFNNFYSLFSFPKYFFKKLMGQGIYQIYGFLVILWVDVLLTDDEPLLEPIEWSMVQSWILFIFIFAWIGENLISSRYGSFTGKDKRLWAGWYRTFWVLDMWYAFNYFVTCIICVVPYYTEVTYVLPLVNSWWNWYTRVFLFKFSFFLTIILFLSYWIQINYRWSNWKKILVPVILINILWGYLLYTQSIILLFGYFTDSDWYHTTKTVDYIQMSHEPFKWGFGSKKFRDNFGHHPSRTVFWFKYDGPFVASFLLFHALFLVTIFIVYIYWIALFRRIWATKEVPLTYTTYCVTNIRHFFYGFLFLYFFVVCSFLVQFLRLPPEYFYGLDSLSWFGTFYSILLDYPAFLLSIF
uniref:Uncharacterized protein n=1 Tax=Strombidium cf. sulcatum TaxID=2793073 RepID=A0A7T0M4L9_9SPIT|nr:hypothetical protein J6674_mgp15 [Strombidium cf. sulcatum]QPL15943.1 hypothetical protein [Strombidium cf. sulcatum]